MRRLLIDDDARALFTCEKCDAKKGEPCIYMLDTLHPPNPDTERGRKIRKLLGTAMPGTHIGRRQKVWRTENKRRRVAEIQQMKDATPPWLVPLREFDARENEAVRQWLRANYYLFGLKRVR